MTDQREGLARLPEHDGDGSIETGSAPDWWLTRPDEISTFLRSLDGVDVFNIGESSSGHTIEAASWGVPDPLDGRTSRSLAAACRRPRDGGALMQQNRTLSTSARSLQSIIRHLSGPLPALSVRSQRLDGDRERVLFFLYSYFLVTSSAPSMAPTTTSAPSTCRGTLPSSPTASAAASPCARCSPASHSSPCALHRCLTECSSWLSIMRNQECDTVHGSTPQRAACSHKPRVNPGFPLLSLAPSRACSPPSASTPGCLTVTIHAGFTHRDRMMTTAAAGFPTVRLPPPGCRHGDSIPYHGTIRMCAAGAPSTGRPPPGVSLTHRQRCATK